MNKIMKIYSESSIQTGKVLGVDKKRVTYGDGFLVSFYEVKIECPDGSIVKHYYYPDKKIKEKIDQWIVFDCYADKKSRCIIHIY